MTGKKKNLKKSTHCLKTARFNVRQQVAKVAGNLRTGIALPGRELRIAALAEEDRAPAGARNATARAAAAAAYKSHHAPRRRGRCRRAPSPLPRRSPPTAGSARAAGAASGASLPNVRWWPGWHRSAPSSEIARPSRKGRRNSRPSARPAAATRLAPGAPLRVSPFRFFLAASLLPSPPFSSFSPRLLSRTLTHPPARPPPPRWAAWEGEPRTRTAGRAGRRKAGECELKAGPGREGGGKERRGGGGGEPGRSDYESAEASLGRRRPQPTRRCSPGDGRTRRAAAGRRGHRAVRGGRGGERAAPPPRGHWGRGSLRVAARRRLYWFPPRPPLRHGEALGPGRATGRAGQGRWPRNRSHLPGQAGAARRGHRSVIHLEFAWKFPLSPSSSSLEPGSISFCDRHFFSWGRGKQMVNGSLLILVLFWTVRATSWDLSVSKITGM